MSLIVAATERAGSPFFGCHCVEQTLAQPHEHLGARFQGGDASFQVVSVQAFGKPVEFVESSLLKGKRFLQVGALFLQDGSFARSGLGGQQGLLQPFLHVCIHRQSI